MQTGEDDVHDAPPASGEVAPASEGDGPLARRLAWTVFALLLALYVATSPGTITGIDAGARWRVARAIWTEGTLSVGAPDDPAVRAFGHVVHAGRGGRAYTHFGPGQSLLLVPFDVVARVVGPRLRPSEPERGERIVLALLFFPLVSAALGPALVLLLHALGATPARAALLALLAGAGTTLLPHAQAHQEEPLVALLAALAALVLARARGRFPARAAAAAAGVACLGFAVRATFVVPFVALLGFGLLEVRRHRGAREDAVRLALAFAAAALVAVAGWLLYDLARFGDPLETGYGIALREGAGLDRRPWLERFVAPLVSPGKSVLLFSPALLLGLIAVARSATPPGLRALGAAGLVMLLGSAALAALTPWWSGDWTWGARLQVHAVPFVLAPAAGLVLAAASMRRLGAVIAGASLCVQALAVTFPYNLEYLDRAPDDPGPYDVWTPSRSPLAARAVHVARLLSGRPVLATPPAGLSQDEVRAAGTPNLFPARIAARGASGAAAAAVALWLAAVAAAAFAGWRLRALIFARPPRS